MSSEEGRHVFWFEECCSKLVHEKMINLHLTSGSISLSSYIPSFDFTRSQCKGKVVNPNAFQSLPTLSPTIIYSSEAVI